MSKLNILSYNSTGFNSAKSDFIKSLVSIHKTDFLCLQEHFLLRSNVFKLQNEFKDFNFSVLPATKPDNAISCGRPTGGLAIIWPKSLRRKVQQLKVNSPSRVQAVMVESKIIVINCYFPCDTQNQNFNEWELLKCFEDIRFLIQSFPDKEVVLAGDLNTDFSRNTPFVNLVRDFVLELKLSDVWWSYPTDFTFTSCYNNRISYSTLDHFIVSDSIVNNISEAGTIHLGDNLSGHEPIYISFKAIFEAPLNPEEVPSTVYRTTGYRPCWNKADANQIQSYKEDLKSQINRINISPGIQCHDVTCSNPSHRIDIDVFCNEILNALDSSTTRHIPPVKTPHEKKLPGWSDLVKPFQEDARFYYAVWESYGKPLNCPIHNLMKQSKNRYHYAVRSIKRQSEKLRNDKLLDHCLKGNATNIVKEFKKQNPCKVSSAVNIDGHTNSTDISNHFASIYKDLYQRHDTADLIYDHLDEINSNITVDNLSEIDILTPGVVHQAISSLKKSKNDTYYTFKSDALVLGKEVLVNHLTLLLQAFLIHSYIPKDILISSLQPIVKDKLGDKCSSSNYRAIGTSSLILKLFDLIILILFGNSLALAEQQFGFLKNSSTTLCTWTVKETVNYFINRDTPVFACFLDMTKAFDLVNYSKLFMKLKDKVSPLYLRLLCYIYLNQKCSVTWNGSHSNQFLVKNGVKQGAILSPTLFSIYIDDLFELLKLSGVGCTINNYYYGAVSYADDIVLLCPSREGLQHMINLTKSFFDNLDLIISLNITEPHKSKTKCIAFGLKVDPLHLKLGNDTIPWTDQYTHLGHVLYRDGTSVEDCLYKRRLFIGKYHSLCQNIKHKDPLVYMKLISIYMCDFYGSNLWNLFSASSDKLYVTWNQMIRYVFKLPYCSHRYLMVPISESPHLKTMLTNRFLKFYASLDKCNKPIVHNLKLIQENDCRSEFGNNVQSLCNLNGVGNISLVKRGSILYHPISDNDKWRVPIIKELLLVLNNTLSLDFNEPDLKLLLWLVSCA